MTQVEKLTQAVGLIRQAMEVYDTAIEELRQKTGKDYIMTQAEANVRAETLVEHFAKAIGDSVLNDM